MSDYSDRPTTGTPPKAGADGRESLSDRAARAFGPSAIATPANLVTFARLGLAPIALVAMWGHPTGWPQFWMWLTLSLSDYVDGAIARRQGTTRSGAFLDPLADKFVVLGGLAAVIAAGWFHPWVWFVTALRELVVSLYRTRAARLGISIPASQLAKWKTTFQLGSVGWITWPWFADMRWLANSFCAIGVAVSLITAALYLGSGLSEADARGHEPA